MRPAGRSDRIKKKHKEAIDTLTRYIEGLAPIARRWLSLSLSACVLFGIVMLVKALRWQTAPTASEFEDLCDMCRSLLLSVGISVFSSYLIHKTVQTH